MMHLESGLNYKIPIPVFCQNLKSTEISTFRINYRLDQSKLNHHYRYIR